MQDEAYLDDQKLRQVVPNAQELALQMRNELGLEDVAARGTAFALVSSNDRSYGVQIMGVEPEYEPKVSSLPGLVREGRYLNDSSASEVIVGRALLENLRAELGDELTLLGTGRDGSFAANVATIVGIYASGIEQLDRAAIMVPIDYFQDTFTMEGAGSSVVVMAPGLREVSEVKQQMAQLLPEDSSLVVRDWDELLPGIKQGIQSDMAGALFQYGILIVLVAFSVLNTQLMSVLERTREFGVVMALGVNHRRLGRVVFLESLLMGLGGALIGILLGLALLLYFSRTGLALPGMEDMMARFNLPGRMYPRFSWIGALLGPALVLLGSLAATIYPTWKLRRLEPVEAMRST